MDFITFCWESLETYGICCSYFQHKDWFVMVLNKLLSSVWSTFALTVLGIIALNNIKSEIFRGWEYFNTQEKECFPLHEAAHEFITEKLALLFPGYILNISYIATAVVFSKLCVLHALNNNKKKSSLVRGHLRCHNNNLWW